MITRRHLMASAAAAGAVASLTTARSWAAANMKLGSAQIDIVSDGDVPTIVAVRTRRHKLVTYPEDPDRPEELYDLARDRRERENLRDDPAHAQVVAELRGQLDRLLRETGYRRPAAAAE